MNFASMAFETTSIKKTWKRKPYNSGKKKPEAKR